MRVARQRSAEDRLFTRTYSDSEGGRAEADPFTHAIHIPNLRPVIGADVVELLPSLAVKEWMIHELSHILTNATRLGAFLKRLVNAIYFALYSLSADVVLHVPSWTINGNDIVSRVFPKIIFLLEDLEPEVRIVDEILRTTQTLVNKAGFVAIHQLTLDEFKAERIAIRATLENDTDDNTASVMIWQLSDQLFRDIVARGAGRASIMQLHMLLLKIDTYVFNPPMASLSEWWRTGSVPPEQAPLARLGTVLRCLEATPGDVDNALSAIAALGSAEQTTRDDGVQPDPFAETANAFGWDPEIVPYTHPVGRAITYLETGYAPSSRAEQTGGQRWRSPALVVPLVEEPSPPRRKCQFEVRVPMESLPRNLSIPTKKRTSAQIMKSLLRTLAPMGIERLTVMPLSKEAGLLWDLQTIVHGLLEDGCLQCDCVTGDAAIICRQHDLIEHVYRYVRTDVGDYLPPFSCRCSG